LLNMLTAKENLRGTSIFGLIILVVALWSAPGSAATNILNIRHWVAPDHARIVIDTSEEAQYRVVKEEMRLRIDIDDARHVPAGPQTISIKKPGIDRIVSSSPADGQVRIELYLKDHTETKVFRVKKFEGKPDRIVIDIILPEVEKKEREDRERVKQYSRDKVIVIDPGHGGEDPGAVGRNGTQEKEVVLAIGKKVRDKLNSQEGYYAFLTREGDYYVSFKKRLRIAREYGADLFLSIHADAARSRRAYGGSVYVLSLRGASNEAAKILASKENLADIVGGTGNGEGTNEESDPIILNMFQTHTMNSSKNFGNLLLKNMAAVNRVKFTTVQEAPFMVLKLPEIPSILVETAYLSNPAEEKKLRSRKFQNEIATAIAASAVEFLSASSPGQVPAVMVKKEAEAATETDGKAKTAVSAEKDRTPEHKETRASVKKPPVVFHMVKRGESVERIARRYHVSPALILKTNDMNPRDPLYVNRKIIIPLPEGSGKPVRKEPGTDEKQGRNRTAEIKTKIYTVAKGDSLDSIAAKHGTTYPVLMKINGIKAKDTIYAGKKIKIPVLVKDQEEKTEAKPPEHTAKEKPSAVALTKYLVKKGDTLEKIAAEHETSVDSLRKLNNMKASDRLYAGRFIIVQGAETDPDADKKDVRKQAAKPSRPTFVYVVKKGDSLDKIARKHRTTVRVIRELNAGQRLSPLYVNQRLKIPKAAKI